MLGKNEEKHNQMKLRDPRTLAKRHFRSLMQRCSARCSIIRWLLRSCDDRLEPSEVGPANLQHITIVSVDLNHELVVAHPDIREVVLLNRARRDLFRNDSGANKISARQTQSDLVQDEFRFFAPIHATVRLHLHVLHHRGSRVDVTVRFADIGQHPSETRLLELHVDLPLAHFAQRLDERDPRSLIRGLVDVLHRLLDDLAQRLLQLRAAL
mmetsp:Transcript_270/g.671  ORF Transcript_270/g.671 Transcript_270/m.671 type:complete len:211 (+) Transcript_270:1989-2621(+)